MCECGCASVCFTTGMWQWRDQAYPLWQSVLSPFRNWVVQFTTVAPLQSHATCSYTHTLTRSHTHSSEMLLDKPLTFTLQSLRSISRPFFHVMFTSLRAIGLQWGDCLWSTTCVHNGHFPWLGPRGEGHQSSIEWNETLGSRERMKVRFLTTRNRFFLQESTKALSF